MNRFKTYIVESEIAMYAFDEDQFLALMEEPLEEAKSQRSDWDKAEFERALAGVKQKADLVKQGLKPVVQYDTKTRKYGVRYIKPVAESGESGKFPSKDDVTATIKKHGPLLYKDLKSRLGVGTSPTAHRKFVDFLDQNGFKSKSTPQGWKVHIQEGKERAPGRFDLYPNMKANPHPDHPYNKLSDSELKALHRKHTDTYNRKIDHTYNIQSRTPETDHAQKEMHILSGISAWREKMAHRQKLADWDAGLDARRAKRNKKPVQEASGDIPLHDVSHHVPHTDPTDKDKKGSNPWKKLRQGAHEYFSASPEEQKQHQKEAHKMKSTALFTDEAANPKLSKSGKELPKYHTKGLFLAPSTMSGVDVCPSASKECRAACLGAHSGRAHMKPVRNSRIDRTHFMFNNPKHFYAKLDSEIETAKKSAAKKGQKLAVRLNGTSDIPHEHIAPQLFAKHHDVQFYDYTKIAGRAKHHAMPANYHLTMSSTGINHADSNWNKVRDHLDKGGVAAMAFHVKTGIAGRREAGSLPTHVHDAATGKTYQVVDGDTHDHRHLDHEYNEIPHGTGVIAGLRIKGGQHTAKAAGKFAVDVPSDGKVVAHKEQN